MNLLSVIAASRRRLDPATATFAAASGATDLAGIDALVKYVKGQSLWGNFRCYPMKSAQNAGSGSTVFGFGGLTSNNMSLVNSPTWGASGIALNGTTQLGRIADFTSAATINVFLRCNKADQAEGITSFFGQYDTGANSRSVWLAQRGDVTGDPLRMSRGSDGAALTLEVYDCAKNGLAADNTFVAAWIAGGGRDLWINKTAQSLSLTTGIAQTDRFDSSADWTLGAFLNSNVPSGFGQMTATAWGFVQASLTTTQRETITDLINAL